MLSAAQLLSFRSSILKLYSKENGERTLFWYNYSLLGFVLRGGDTDFQQRVHNLSFHLIIQEANEPRGSASFWDRFSCRCRFTPATYAFFFLSGGISDPAQFPYILHISTGLTRYLAPVQHPKVADQIMKIAA